MGSQSNNTGVLVMAIGDIFHFIANTVSRQFLIRLACFQVEGEGVIPRIASVANHSPRVHSHPLPITMCTDVYDLLGENPSQPIRVDLNHSAREL